MGKNFSMIVQLILLALFSFSTAYGSGELDPNFPASATGGSIGTINAVKIQPDGKVLIGGMFTDANGVAATAIARLNADGSTDTSFRGPDFSNETAIGREIRVITLQIDGKILVGGSIVGADNILKRGLVRLNADGSIDTAFNLYGLPAGSVVNDVAVQPDNKILVGGVGMGMLRLNPDGSFDNTFTPYPTSNSGVEDIEIQPDGQIIIVGRNDMKRFTTTGALDAGFNQSNSFTSGTNTTVKVRLDGKVIVGGSFVLVNGAAQKRLCLFSSAGVADSTFSSQGPDGSVNDIVIKPDGKILIGGAFSLYNTTPRIGVAQINADGSLDATSLFGTTGTTSGVTDLEPQADGKVLLGLQFGISRLNADGSADPAFAPLVTTGGVVKKVVQQTDGKVLAAGDFVYAGGVAKNSLARFNANGSLDAAFSPFSSALPIAALALQPDGKIMVGTGSRLIRLNPDGSPDLDTTLAAVTIIYDIVPLASGQMLVGGWKSGIGACQRLNANGSVDSAFAAPFLNAEVDKIVARPDGKILIGGQFSGGIKLLNSDGSLDGTFTGNASGVILDLDLQADGKVIVGGSFTSLNGSGDRINIGRLNADGTLDTGFVQSTNGAVFAVKLQPDGKILIGGTMTAVQGGPHNGIARLNSNGTVDAVFNTLANTTVSDINLQTDGKILIGGSFTKIDRVSAPRVARLLNPSASARRLFDFDGDGKADVSVFRPSENRWYVLRSSDGQVSQQIFAIAGDVPVPADYDGDGKTDFAVFRPPSGDWWYLSSINNSQNFAHWGQSGDIPRPSDFDGDGKFDYVIFRPSNNVWYRISSSSAVSSNIVFGSAGDKPVTGDFDGDGRSDVAIYRPSTGDWWWQSSVDNVQRATHWGISTDIPVPGDYDGDGETDFAVYRASSGTWYIYNSASNSSTILNFGLSEDKPVAGDYDGDGKADIAVFRPSTGIWYLLRSTAGFSAFQFGVSTDTPVPNVYVP